MISMAWSCSSREKGGFVLLFSLRVGYCNDRDAARTILLEPDSFEESAPGFVSLPATVPGSKCKVKQ